MIFRSIAAALAVASVAMLAVASADKNAPNFGTRYYTSGTISMPYHGIKEPFATWYDGQAKRQKIVYYDGLDTYIYLEDLQTRYQVNPVVSSYRCFGFSGPDAGVSLTPFFPDLTTFDKAAGKFDINGIECDKYSQTYGVGKKIGTYDFYVDSLTGAPVQYHWVGFDRLFGSHFDEYVVDYTTFTSDPVINTTTFAKPNMDCTGFPGPGYSDPGSSLASIFPWAGSTKDLHNQFSADHGKHYTPEEGAKRHKVFESNLRYIHMANRKARSEDRSLVLAVNRFADYYEDELDQMAGVTRRTRSPSGNGANSVHTASGRTLPSSVNWVEKGAVTSVKDQGICGSCWAHAASETIEGTHYLKYGKLVTLSPQELMDCSWPQGNLACDGGEDFQGYRWILGEGGLATTSSYGPYLMADGLCHPHKPGVEVGARITGYVNVTVGSDVALTDALYTKGPISVSIDASLKSFSFYDSGVYDDPACKNDPDSLDHSVLAVGYGTENGEDYFLVKNSWSTHWGDNGYVKMARGKNECGISTAATYTTM